MRKAVGILEVLGYSIALAAMDTACKAADISIEGIDCNNPKQGDAAAIPLTTQVKFTGPIADVKIALEAARTEAGNHLADTDIITHLIPATSVGMEDILAKGKVKPKG